ncbi:OmpA family protein [Magnetovibrio sp. PR-2]|uniref:OmpA family protein n=1 Tax=Magnetovibrio sp. PR-2 TaxID=3120356 RepID=UPI002FCE0299
MNNNIWYLMFSTRRTFATLTSLSLFCALTPAVGADPAQEPSWTDGLYAGAALGAVQAKDTTASGTSGGSVDFEPGVAGAVFAGSKLNDTFRLELELSQRSMGLDSVASASASGDAKAQALIGNAIVDLDLDLPITPYVGGGVGLARVSLNNASPFGGSTIDDTDTALALQGIAGASYQLNDAVDVFADYRYFTTGDANFSTAAGTSTSADLTTHSVMAGLRLNFNLGPTSSTLNGSDSDANAGDTIAQAEPVAGPAPEMAEQPKPVHTIAETFLVNFEFNKADITDDGVAIIEGVVHTVKAAKVTRLVLTGHADTMGPADYNMKLSVQRAEAVKTALLALGFEADNIRVIGKGETDLLIPTPDNTFEPKNRRVEIVLP